MTTPFTIAEFFGVFIAYNAAIEEDIKGMNDRKARIADIAFHKNEPFKKWDAPRNLNSFLHINRT